MIQSVSQVFDQRMPHFQKVDLTPSEMFNSKGGSNTDLKFFTLLQSLAVDYPTVSSNGTNFVGVFKVPFHFNAKDVKLWKTSKLDENRSYSILIDYFATMGIRCFDVSHGKHVVQNRLFSVDLFNLRTSLNEHGNMSLKYHTRLTGTTDLVILKDDASKMIEKVGRHNVKVAIEIKRPCEFNLKNDRLCGAIREGVCQLIGLCSGNFYCCPPVIVTNLIF